MNCKTNNSIYLGIFCICIGVLLFEISLTRIFSLILFSNYAFMIISTAVFGIGLSGVILAMFPDFLKKYQIENLLLFFSVGFATTVLLSFITINNVPLQMANLKEMKNLSYLAIYYFSLIVPFGFSGMVIATLFTSYSEKIPKLYFFDLVGAGLGCLLTVPFFVKFGGLGTLYAVSLIGLLAGIIFSIKRSKLSKIISPILVIIWVIIFPIWKKQEIKVHEYKRSYKNDVTNKTIEYTKWSSLSKIDIAPGPKDFFKRLWIDGGTNESALISFDGKYHTDYLGGMDKLLISFPYLVKKNPEVAIIGSSGGREVLLALNHDPVHVTAIEMDPTICEVVSKTYAKYIGDIFNDPRVTLVCDEGRSFIRRSEKSFDVIQQVNNFTPIAMASGAINLSESYLLTEEAFKDYILKLKDDGILALNRHNTFKIFLLAKKVLSELGLDAGKHMIVIKGEDQLNNGFFMKKTPYTQAEIDLFLALAKERNLEAYYYPEISDENNWYVKAIKEKDSVSFFNLSGLNLLPPTDDKPFFEHIGALGRIDVSDPNIPKGLLWVDAQKKIKRNLAIEDMILLVIFLEATVFSVIFIFTPLFVFSKKGIQTLTEFKVLAYFFSVGIAFILIEICLMQKFVLFLGVPVYAISVVLFALLSSTGLGSLITSRFENNTAANLRNVMVILFALLIASNYLMPYIMQLLLGKAFFIRILASIGLIFPLGILMGMPFPLGMKLLVNSESRLIAWAWGINGYATVIGSVLAIAFARFLGFKMVFILSGIIYMLGYLAIRNLKKK